MNLKLIQGNNNISELTLQYNEKTKSYAITNINLGIRSIECKFSVFVEHPKSKKKFYILKIIQHLTLKSSGDKNNPSLQLVPNIWMFEELNPNRSSVHHKHIHQGLHPLLKYNANGNSHTFEFNCLVMDVTDYWLHIRKKNNHYEQILNSITSEETIGNKFGFRIMANLCGNPFIWYMFYPKSIIFSKNIIPNIFYGAADNCEEQPILDNEEYFFDLEYASGTKEEVSKCVIRSDGVTVTDGRALRDYFASPLAEESLEKDFDKVNKVFKSFDFSQRNVNIYRNGIFNIWRIPNALGRAIASSNNHLFFALQRKGASPGNRPCGTTPILKNIIDSAVKFYRSNTEVLGQDFRSDPTVDKMVLTCYSDSGRSIKHIFNEHQEFFNQNTKAIIFMEPVVSDKASENSMELSQLIKKINESIEIHYIGRWKTPNAKITKNASSQFALKTAILNRKKIYLYPENNNFDGIYAFPPIVQMHSFIQFRNFRFFDLNSDPYMTKEERDTLDKIGLTGQALINKIFPDSLNMDSSGNYYSHNLCVTGGQIFEFEEKQPLYGKKPKKYISFLQEVLSKIR